MRAHFLVSFLVNVPLIPPASVVQGQGPAWRHAPFFSLFSDPYVADSPSDEYGGINRINSITPALKLHRSLVKESLLAYGNYLHRMYPPLSGAIKQAEIAIEQCLSLSEQLDVLTALPDGSDKDNIFTNLLKQTVDRIRYQSHLD